jgi:peroxiredoxin (alkyl hydroperoxide reductase subunit C)
LHAFQEKLAEFASRHTAVVGISTDTEQCHWAWLQTPKNHGGIQGVKYPLVADANKTISSAFDVLNGEFGVDEDGNLSASSEMIAYRALFLIDKEGVVRHQLVNDLPLGRSVDEALRIVDALCFFEEHGEVCPANWSVGKDGMKADHAGVASYLSKH